MSPDLKRRRASSVIMFLCTRVEGYGVAGLRWSKCFQVIAAACGGEWATLSAWFACHLRLLSAYFKSGPEFMRIDAHRAGFLFLARQKGQTTVLQGEWYEAEVGVLSGRTIPFLQPQSSA